MVAGHRRMRADGPDARDCREPSAGVMVEDLVPRGESQGKGTSAPLLLLLQVSTKDKNTPKKYLRYMPTQEQFRPDFSRSIERTRRLHDFDSPRRKLRDPAIYPPISSGTPPRFPPKSFPRFCGPNPETVHRSSDSRRVSPSSSTAWRQVFQSLRSTCTTAVLTWSTRSPRVLLRLSMSPDVSHRS